MWLLNAECWNLVTLKGAWSDYFRFFKFFFPSLLRFWYQKKDPIFLITPGEFYSWKMYRLKDMNETMSSYGNHKFTQ